MLNENRKILTEQKMTNNIRKILNDLIHFFLIRC